MSRTFKVASFDQTERYINELKTQQRNLQSQMNSVEKNAKNAARKEAEKRAQELRHEIDLMERNLENQLGNLSAEMKSNYLEHKRDLNTKTKEFQRNISDLKNWTKQSLHILKTEVDSKFQEQQSQINHNRGKLNEIFQKEANAKEQAEKNLKDLVALVKIIEGNTNHQKFAEGELHKINSRIKHLFESDIPSESVISNAFSITNDLYDLETDIIKKENLFNVRHTMILNQAQELLKIMNHNRNELYFKDEEGNELRDDNDEKIQVEVNFWTENEYQKTEDLVKELETELIEKKKAPELDNARLDEITDTLEIFKKKQETLVITACERGLASEERIVISDDLIQAFLEQGFELKDGIASHNFMGNEENNTETDQREGVVAVLKNGVGTEITLIIQPDRTKKKNKIIFHRNDEHDLSEREYTEYLQKINDYIESKGYDMGELSAPKGIGDVRLEALADVNALKKVGLGKKLKEQLS
ncbi:hypothetical protein H2O64_15010 [Kordia sp. YSTF-M3]|uniref:Uncharacterized protein n=1 Tax=Kordia aestuariivivens TaxID=2759037 RepID=A0ABR7QBP6_9FLAO|nr:hypothetical protein [Kordia aestuariivivens]MBC8755986.1 hypothetical protein [Kordia aestuariivivens]